MGFRMMKSTGLIALVVSTVFTFSARSLAEPLVDDTGSSCVQAYETADREYLGRSYASALSAEPASSTGSAPKLVGGMAAAGMVACIVLTFGSGALACAATLGPVVVVSLLHGMSSTTTADRLHDAHLIHQIYQEAKVGQIQEADQSRAFLQEMGIAFIEEKPLEEQVVHLMESGALCKIEDGHAL